MKISNSNKWNIKWLKSPSVNFIWKILSSTGAEVFFVGGCVRDSFHGHEIKDIDIATDSQPSDVVKIIQSAGLQAIKTGFDHGSVTVFYKKKVFEITSFRSDVVSDGRHAKVKFSSNILDDAKRRDFTMNALYMNINGEIIDPISGWEDLSKGRVRFIGNPEKRIHEDYLRILRYFRFLSTYEKNMKSVDYEVLKACSNSLSGLKTLSQNRIWGELQRILLAEDPYPTLKLMQFSGILDEILPDAKIDILKKFLTFEKRLQLNFRSINRLAALNIVNVSSWIKKFPVSKEQNSWLEQILINIQDPLSLRIKGYKYGVNLAITALAIFKSDSVSELSDHELAEINFGSSQQFPIKPKDLLKFFSPSKELGDELRRLKDIWFESNLELGRSDLMIKFRETYSGRPLVIQKKSN